MGCFEFQKVYTLINQMLNFHLHCQETRHSIYEVVLSQLLVLILHLHIHLLCFFIFILLFKFTILSILLFISLSAKTILSNNASSLYDK